MSPHDQNARTVYLCEGLRTPIGRYGGALASVRADDLRQCRSGR